MTCTTFAVPPWPRVDLWWIDLTAPCNPRILSDAECARADRFRTADLARRFVARRVARRLVLSLYCGRSPESLDFSDGKNGKPALADGGAHFSASCSGEHAVIAVGAREMGVDVEVVRSLSDLDRLVEATCSEHERAWLAGHDEPDRTYEFFKLWAAKEAAVKLSGEGLVADLKRVVEGSGVVRIEAPQGCVAALAAATPPVPVARQFRFW